MFLALSLESQLELADSNMSSAVEGGGRGLNQAALVIGINGPVDPISYKKLIVSNPKSAAVKTGYTIYHL